MQMRYNVFQNDTRGTLELTDNELKLQLSKIYHMRPSYVDRVEKTTELGLDKVGVRLDYYDLFGNKETVLFAMHDSEYRSLKKALGK